MLNTVAQLRQYTEASGPGVEPSLMNFCVSDGTSVVATRYITSATEEAASLFFSTGSTFAEVEPGTFKMNKADKRERIILIASEPLTFERADWVEIPSQSCIVITPRVSFPRFRVVVPCRPRTHRRPCRPPPLQNNLLRYPIVDHYFQPNAVSNRADRYAKAKGYRWARPVAVEAN
ncbi:SPOSA6832_03274, partial [Sporobolomyces salmonicolor]